MKLRKVLKRLKARVAEWESLRPDRTAGANTKVVNGNAFHRPGSNKK